MRRLRLSRWALACAGLAAMLGLGLTPPARAYEVEQAIGGRAVFEQNCAVCHGANLQGSFFIPALVGRGSRLARDFPTAAEMYAAISTRMPQDRPGILPSDEYWQVLTFILSQNAIEPDGVTLGPDNAFAVPISVGGPPINLDEWRSAPVPIVDQHPVGMGDVDESIPIEDVVQE